MCFTSCNIFHMVICNCLYFCAHWQSCLFLMQSCWNRGTGTSLAATGQFWADCALADRHLGHSRCSRAELNLGSLYSPFPCYRSHPQSEFRRNRHRHRRCLWSWPGNSAWRWLRSDLTVCSAATLAESPLVWGHMTGKGPRSFGQDTQEGCVAEARDHALHSQPPLDDWCVPDYPYSHCSLSLAAQPKWTRTDSGYRAEF